MTRVWIKDPLAILADGADRGVVVRDGIIAELVPKGGLPRTPDVAIFEAGQHFVLPGLINTHHFYQTLTRAVAGAGQCELFEWLKTSIRYGRGLRPPRSSAASPRRWRHLLLSGCTTTTDHHYVFPPGLENAIDIEVAVARRLDMRAVLTRGSIGVYRPRAGAERNRRRQGCGSRTIQARRTALRRLWRCARGGCSGRGPSRRSRDDRRALGGRRRRHRRLIVRQNEMARRLQGG